MSLIFLGCFYLQFVYVLSYFPCLWNQIYKNMSITDVSKVTAYVFFQEFYGFQSYSKVLYGISYWSSFILLHVTFQFFQYHLLTRLSFLHFLFFDPLSQMSIYKWAYFQALSSVPLIYMSVFVPVAYCFYYQSFVVQFEIRECGTSISILLLQDKFDYSRSFVTPFKFQNYLFQFCTICHWHFEELHRICRLHCIKWTFQRY